MNVDRECILSVQDLSPGQIETSTSAQDSGATAIPDHRCVRVQTHVYGVRQDVDQNVRKELEWEIQKTLVRRMAPRM